MRALRSLALAAAAAVTLFAAPASEAAFTNSDMNSFITMVNGLEGLTEAQSKAVDQINAVCAKEYATFSKELVAYAKVVTIAKKAFATDEAVLQAIQQLCDNQGPGSVFLDLTAGSDGTGAAGVVLLNNMDATKAGLLLYKWVSQHFNKGALEPDCAKRFKFWAKAAHGAEKVFQKYGPLPD